MMDEKIYQDWAKRLENHKKVDLDAAAHHRRFFLDPVALKAAVLQRGRQRKGGTAASSTDAINQTDDFDLHMKLYRASLVRRRSRMTMHRDIALRADADKTQGSLPQLQRVGNYINGNY